MQNVQRLMTLRQTLEAKKQRIISNGNLHNKLLKVNVAGGATLAIFGAAMVRMASLGIGHKQGGMIVAGVTLGVLSLTAAALCGMIAGIELTDLLVGNGALDETEDRLRRVQGGIDRSA